MSLPVALRLATAADAKDIAELSRDVIERGLPWRWTEERIRRCLRDERLNVLVAREPGRLQAFGIMQYGEEEAHLLLFAVHPACRRLGVGAAVLGWLEAVARTAGLQRVLLECRRDNEVGRNFYGAQGYHERIIVRRMYEGVEDGIRLEKWLVAEPQG
jgi:ribosomal-protein-alanine N-acetyltransferase